MSKNVMDFIEKNWDRCIAENRFDEGTLIGLPYPYTVPAVGHFDEMYYWDTYFTNVGLIISGRAALAKNNVDNMLYLINKYGFMPNGNRVCFLYNSQPPYAAEMVRCIYDYYKDKAWLFGAYKCLEKEYDFWMTERISDVGLNSHGGKWCKEDEDILKTSFEKRVGIALDIPDIDIIKHYRSCGESGWDCNPRWGFEGFNYAQVDLNALLYLYEKNMSYFSTELLNGNAELWDKRAENRRKLMGKYLSNSEGIMLDYNFKSDSLSEILSVASYMPMFAKMSTYEQAKALVDNLYRLESNYGILTCEKNTVEGNYQWDYPSGWACLQYIMFVGLDNYGYKKEAKRVAEKYVSLVEKVFDKTGNLWEKYNVVEGNISVKSEDSKMPPMMGWSAGVYIAAKEYIEKSDEGEI